MRWRSSFVALALMSRSASADIFFESEEDTLAENAAMPSPKWSPYPDALIACRRGHVRSIAGNPHGRHVVEFEALASCNGQPPHDLFNELHYDTRPPNGGTLYVASFFRAVRIGGLNLWRDPDPGVEAFDRALELVGPAYRFTVNLGVRDHYYSAASAYDARFSLFVTQPDPGHFNTESYHCGPLAASWEDYDSYWQNMNGFGGSRPNTECYPMNVAQPFWMEYDRWYSIVAKVVFAGDDTGSIEVWIDGVQVLGVSQIQTCGMPAAGCVHDTAQLFGTYSQPGYQGVDHRRLVDGLIITDDRALLETRGYFGAPSQTTDGGVADGGGLDAGELDAGATDGGVDAGEVNAGEDAGPLRRRTTKVLTCGSATTVGLDPALLGLLAALGLKRKTPS